MPGRSIDRRIIETLLLGEARSGNIQRFTQDGGVVVDVWNRFADDLLSPVRVLLSPAEGATAVDMAFELNRCLKAYRRSDYANDGLGMIRHEEASGVALLNNFVAATIYVDELLRVVMPLTKWWSDKRLGRMRFKAEIDYPLQPLLRDEIMRRMRPDSKPEPARRLVQRRQKDQDERAQRDFRVIEAAPIAAMIGVIRMTLNEPQNFELDDWVASHADLIAEAAVREFNQQLIPELAAVTLTSGKDSVQAVDTRERTAPALIQRVFLDRKGTIAQSDALACVKADASTRLFDISCNKIAWAIIDSGIAAQHPAFFDWEAIERKQKAGEAINPWTDAPSKIPHRVRAIYDFTLIDQIRNYELAPDPDDAEASLLACRRVLRMLEDLPGRQSSPHWRKLADVNLRAIAKQLGQRLQPDWRLIEPLIRIDPDDGENLPSDHGTHVAGTLGADWRLEDAPPLLQGICPDINIYDLRVIPSAEILAQSGSMALEATEFAVVAATEFVQHLNREAGSNGPVIHGVNISLSIPHDVRNYGCGATPICVACDGLVSSGVVVVAAAGNRGWNEQELGFGNFTFCSITDPGNALDVITVGSTHRSRPHTYGVSYFSSRGPTGDGRIKPDIVAPGEKIRGPVRGNALQEYDGTSMAAPFVSGAAAMLMARNRELIRNPERVKAILCDTATDLGRERYFQGHGLLDTLRALQKQ